MFTIAASVALFAQAAHANQCTFQKGDTIHLEEMEVLFDKVSSQTMIKGEFETTEAYEKRKSIASTSLNETLLLKAPYNPEHVEYNADTETFTINTKAWDYIITPWYYVYELIQSKTIDVGGTNYAVSLSSSESSVGAYNATNAFGTVAQVIQTKQIHYAVFDKKKSGYPRLPMWNGDIKVEFGPPSVLINMPIEKAAAFKENIQVGILIKPKEPFAAVATATLKPNINFPVERDTTINAFVGDILCAVIANGEGVVQKVVDIGYR